MVHQELQTVHKRCAFISVTEKLGRRIKANTSGNQSEQGNTLMTSVFRTDSLLLWQAVWLVAISLRVIFHSFWLGSQFCEAEVMMVFNSFLCQFLPPHSNTVNTIPWQKLLPPNLGRHLSPYRNVNLAVRRYVCNSTTHTRTTWSYGSGGSYTTWKNMRFSLPPSMLLKHSGCQCKHLAYDADVLLSKWTHHLTEVIQHGEFSEGIL